MNRENRYLRRICSLVGEPESVRAVGLFVEQRRTPGDSLRSVAQKLGVTEVVEEPLPFDGGVFREEDGRLVIKLNAGGSPLRRRFTLAHEVAHLLVGTVPGFRKACLSDGSLERTCDLVAAELLMPVDEVTSFVMHLGQPSPEKLKAVAAGYDVSLHAAAIRVCGDLRLWKCCAGLWRLQEAAVRTDWFVGPRRWGASGLSPYSFELAVKSPAAVRVRETWRRGAFSDPVWLQLLRLGNRAVFGLVSFVS